MPKNWRRRLTRGLIFAIAVTAAVAFASPASAAYNDSFTVATTDGCGTVDFVDYGPGAPGGGNNDDYFVVHDYCSDGHGVRAAADLYIGNVSLRHLGQRYNGNGLAGDPVVWDPFAQYDNVHAGDAIVVQVCLVDGATDLTPLRCRTVERLSIDG